MARQLVELGYRGSGEVLRREEFETRKQQALASKLTCKDQDKLVTYILQFHWVCCSHITKFIHRSLKHVSGVLEQVRPSGHGRTNILTKKGMPIFFYTLSDLLVVVKLGLSNLSGQIDFSQD